MRRETAGKLLRIFVDESDRFGDKPAYVAIVEALRAAGFAGASVFKGIEGFGRSGRLHTARVFDLSTDLPVLIEVAEEEEKLEAFLPTLRSILSSGIVTIEALRVVTFGRQNP